MRHITEWLIQLYINVEMGIWRIQFCLKEKIYQKI